MDYRNWEISCVNQEDARKISGAGIPPLVAKVLSSRGFSDAAGVLDFLDAGTGRLCDPALLPEIMNAAARIKQAVFSHEHIAVYGDYDVDGITAVCLMVKYLRTEGARCSYYIPSRFEEGYGLNIDALKRLKDDGVTLVITVDSGITAINEAIWAKESGIDLIITDHHECMETLPDALAVINPMRPDSAYPFKTLAGVGVALKLVCFLSGGDIDGVMNKYSYLAAIGTIADVMPVTGENRAIAAHGLRRMFDADSVGLRMLIDSINSGNKEITSNFVGFSIAPRINAAGRLFRADTAAELFLTEDEDKARELSGLLCGLNEERRTLEQNIFDQAKAQLENVCHDGEYGGNVIVLYGDGWHQGVIGIVASRVAEHYHRPAFLICLDGNVGKASARSYNGLNLYSALEYCAFLLETYGGHDLAAGFTIKRENIAAFKTRLEEYARINSRNGKANSLKADCEVSLSELTLENVESLSILEPHGTMNPYPVFIVKNAIITELSSIGGGKHLRIRLFGDKVSINCVFFSMDIFRLGLSEGDVCDALFSPRINVFKNTRSVQLVIQDIKLSGELSKREKVELEIYKRYKDGAEISRDEATRLIPPRPVLLSMWRYLKQNTVDLALSEELGCLCRKAARSSGLNYTVMNMLVCLDVFSEYRLMNYTLRDGRIDIKMNKTGGVKVDLSGSKILSELRNQH